MPFVLDASLTLAYLLAYETSARADALFDRLKEERAVVPGLWPFEVANGLAMAGHRKRIPGGTAARLAGDLAALPIDMRE